jgi:hypothetical protein
MGLEVGFLDAEFGLVYEAGSGIVEDADVTLRLACPPEVDETVDFGVSVEDIDGSVSVRETGVFDGVYLGLWEALADEVGRQCRVGGLKFVIVGWHYWRSFCFLTGLGGAAAA